MKKALVFVLALSMLLLAFGCGPVQDPYEVDEDKVVWLDELPEGAFRSNCREELTYGDYVYWFAPEDGLLLRQLTTVPTDEVEVEIVLENLDQTMFDVVIDDTAYFLMRDDLWAEDRPPYPDYMVKLNLETGEAERCDRIMHSLMHSGDYLFGIEYHFDENNCVNKFTVYKQSLKTGRTKRLCTIDRTNTGHWEHLIGSPIGGGIYMKILEDGYLYTYECKDFGVIENAIFRIDIDTGKFQKVYERGIPRKVEDGILYVGPSVWFREDDE